MQTASYTGFFRILLIIVGLYYVIKFLARIFLPILLRKAVEKAGENFTQHQQGQQQKPYGSFQQTGTPEKPRETKKVGEYVDFEEID